MARSRKLVLTDWTQANDALMQYFEGNKSKLAEHVKMSRTTVTNFFNEEPVSESQFRKICLALRLNWQEVSSVYAIVPSKASRDRSHGPVSSTALLKLFISYSEKDDDLRKELEKHLALLKRQGKIRAWSKESIEAGSEWEKETEKELGTADIILLLISPDFIASDNCYGKELEQAIQRHKDGTARVIPIILRPTYLKGSFFSALQPLPKNAEPITTWQNKDEAFLDVADGICQAIELLQEQCNNIQLSQKKDVGVVRETDDFYDLIQQIREHCRQKILDQHSRMRLLSGEEIGVDQLYVDVYLLAKPEHKHFNSSESLLRSFNIEKDRLALSRRIQRNPGFEVTNRNTKLVILGKPGSGKTTFLKHLAVDWCNGKFQPELITILIELRRIQDEKWNLLSAIKKELGLDEEQKNQLLLEQGSLLVLMDGLDEVPTNVLRSSVQKELKTVSNKYPNNRFILTCRTQIIGEIPHGFTCVEVADFKDKQVEQFVLNWFKASGKSDEQATKQWEKINSAVANKPDLKEITVTPVLLNLICLVLQDEGDIPSDRAWLYKKSIKLLLSRWNREKQIDGWEVGTEAYRKLKIEDKETLLIEIAARKFENPKNDNFVLFEQDELTDQITEKLQLSNRREGVGVLKAIEAQHGLLVERADELWSFSHLTFQEYFTVQWLTRLSPGECLYFCVSRCWFSRENGLGIE